VVNGEAGPQALYCTKRCQKRAGHFRSHAGRRAKLRAKRGAAAWCESEGCRKPAARPGKRGPRPKYCSLTCKDKATAKNHPSVNHPGECARCGKPFVGEKEARYCSPDCGRIHRHELNGTKRVNKMCAECSRSFKPGKRDGKYCSLECYAVAIRKYPLTVPCEVCGTEFPFATGTNRAGGKKIIRCCSRACGVELRRRTLVKKQQWEAAGPKRLTTTETHGVFGAELELPDTLEWPDFTEAELVAAELKLAKPSKDTRG